MRRRPLPPTTDHGVRERLLDDVRAESRRGRGALFVGLVAVATFILIAALSAYQATGEHRASALLQSGIATITDIDTLLDEQLPAARAEAAGGAVNDILLPAFPVRVTLTRDEILENDDAEIRALLLERAAAAVYVQGLEAFDSTGNQSLGFVSAEGALDRVVGQLTGKTHSRAATVTLIAVVLAVLAGTLALVSDRSYRTLRAIAIAIAAGAFPGLLLSAAGVYAMDRIGGSDPFVNEITHLLGDLFEVPRRNYLVVMLCAAALAVASYAFERVVAFEARGARDPSALEFVPAYVHEPPLAPGETMPPMDGDATVEADEPLAVEPETVPAPEEEVAG